MGSAWDNYDDQYYDPEAAHRRDLAKKQREIDTLKYEREVEEMAKKRYTPRVSLEKALDGKCEWLCGRCGCTVVDVDVHTKVCPGRNNLFT